MYDHALYRADLTWNVLSILNFTQAWYNWPFNFLEILIFACANIILFVILLYIEVTFYPIDWWPKKIWEVPLCSYRLLAKKDLGEIALEKDWDENGIGISLRNALKNHGRTFYIADWDGN